MRIIAIIVALALAGCGLATGYQIAHMTPDELTKLSDADLCHPFTGSNPAITAERQKRDLADCDHDHLYCHSLGLKSGTDAYVQCRLKARQIAAEEAIAGAQQQQAGCSDQSGYSEGVPATAAGRDQHYMQHLRQYDQLHTLLTPRTLQWTGSCFVHGPPG